MVVTFKYAQAQDDVMRLFLQQYQLVANTPFTPILTLFQAQHLVSCFT